MKIVLFISTLIVSISFAQVGIGTTNPLDMLHIAGDTRIDGLNNINPLNNGVYTKVYADSNGKLVLGAEASEAIIEDQIDILPVAVGVLRGNSRVLYAKTFDVEYTRLVKISSTISLAYYQNIDEDGITNGMNRITGSILKLNGNEISEDRDDYSNYGGSYYDIMVGYNYLKNYREMLLTPGTYTLELSVFVATGGGETYVKFGGNNVDVLSIIQD